MTRLFSRKIGILELEAANLPTPIRRPILKKILNCTTTFASILLSTFRKLNKLHAGSLGDIRRKKYMEVSPSGVTFSEDYSDWEVYDAIWSFLLQIV